GGLGSVASGSRRRATPSSPDAGRRAVGSQSWVSLLGADVDARGRRARRCAAAAGPLLGALLVVAFGLDRLGEAGIGRRGLRQRPRLRREREHDALLGRRTEAGRGIAVALVAPRWSLLRDLAGHDRPAGLRSERRSGTLDPGGSRKAGCRVEIHP